MAVDRAALRRAAERAKLVTACVTLTADEALSLADDLDGHQARWQSDAKWIAELHDEIERLRKDNAALRDQIPPERFPTLGGPSVPWSMVAPHEKQAIANHDQSLRRLAERGGLSPGELWCIVHNRKWREQPDEKTALAWLRAWAGIGIEGARDQLRAELAAMTAARDRACDGWEDTWRSELQTSSNPNPPAEIAELRRVGVK
jgi:hypothetical protein